MFPSILYKLFIPATYSGKDRILTKSYNIQYNPLKFPNADDYYWMNDRENPDVIAYLKAENGYKEAVMKHTEPLQEKLLQIHLLWHAEHMPDCKQQGMDNRTLQAL